MTGVQIANLLTLYLFGEKVEYIGAHFHIHHCTVSRIVRRHHLPLRGRKGHKHERRILTGLIPAKSEMADERT